MACHLPVSILSLTTVQVASTAFTYSFIIFQSKLLPDSISEGKIFNFFSWGACPQTPYSKSMSMLSVLYTH